MNIDTHNARMKTPLNNAHRRGSAVVVVTVMLVIMVLLGMAYLQTAQVQRFASFDDQGDVDTQIDAIIAQIQQVLKDDLTDPNATGPTENEFEPYDYPWTNQDSNSDWEITLFDGSTALAKGNNRDDVWLAAMIPAFGATNNWPHVTNLNGVFLNYDNTTNDFTLVSGVPDEHVVDFSGGNEHTDTDVPLGYNQLVDADGDGIEDSRWTWAPIKTINGVTYVMAVRIVDLSGMVNVNVAQSLIDSSGNYDATAEGTDAPRWTDPAELDIGRFVLDGSAVGSASTHMTELQDSLEYRFNDTLPAPPPAHPLVPLTWRNGFWNEQGRFADAQDTPAPGYSLYSRADAYELVRRKGLNKDTATGGNTRTIEASGDGMPQFLRAAAAESTFSDVDATRYGGSASATRQEFFELEPRHQMTPLSGAAIFAATVPGTTFDADSIKTDLNDADAAEIANVVDTVYSQGSATMPGGFGNAADFANQFTANIIDYRDTDNELTVLDPDGSPGSGDEVYGMEALPAIAEVYVQRHYSATASSANSANSSLFDVTWQADGPAGYAIEIRNPFPHPISLENVNVIVGGNNWGALNTLAGQNTLGAYEELILHRDSFGGGNDDVTALFASAPDNENAITEDWPNTPVWATDTTLGTSQQPTTEAIEIELQATDDNGDPRTYVKATSFSMPDEYTQVRVDNHTGSPDEGYWQRADLGNGEKINTLLIAASEFASPESNPSDGYQTTMDRLTQETKGGPANKVGPNAEQLLIADREFAHIGDLAHIAAIGPTDTETVPQVYNNVGSLNGFRLDFTAGSMGSDNYDVPHAVFLIDQFTTLSPRTDGVDNDGDNTTDNDSENMVRGTINLNTAPQHLLEKVLPIPDQTLRNQVAQDIVTYRNNPDNRAGGSYKGIAYVGELFGNDASSSPVLGNPLATNGTDDRAIGSGPTVIDFLSNPNATTADTIVDDREEQAMLAKWLSQVGSTRSDYFAAYVIVRGYTDAGFSSGTPVEAARFIAIFERNAENGEVKVKALLPGSDPYMVK